MRSKTTFLIGWSALAALKLALAFALPLFGDEAFYWWEGQHPAWSYSDLPPLTAWLAALGGALLPGEIGVRAPFLLLGLLLPWQVVAVTRRWFGDEATAWRAGLLALVLPLSATLGVLALPDVPLAIVSLFAVEALVAALRDGRRRDWLRLGLGLAVGVLCHYRFGALALVMAVVMLAHPAGRAALRTRGPWLAAAIGLFGLVPLLLFNFGHDLAGLRFQLVDRHPWAWQGSGLLQLAEQAFVVSPLLFGALAWAVWEPLRRRPVPWPECIVVPVAAGLWLLFFALGFFADNERFRWHWPLSAYLPLLPVLAARLPRWRRGFVLALFAIAAGSSVLIIGYFALAAAPQQTERWLAGKRFPANFSGWREAADWLSSDAGAAPERIVVDNFMLAAALRFYARELDDVPVLVLDDELNRRHGRATQLAIWGSDEQALAAAPSAPGWIVAEETARRFSDRWSWYQALCARFDGLELDGALTLYGGRKRFVRWRFAAYDPQPSCKRLPAIPPLGWVDAPARLRRGESLSVFGWVAQPELGIDAIELLWDGITADRPRRSIDIHWVEERWGDIGDPAGRTLGFRSEIHGIAAEPGRHRLTVRVRRGDGREWLLHEQDVLVEN